MEYETVKDAITTLGFPVAVATFLLWRTDKVLRDISKTLTKIVDRLEREHV